MHCPRKVTGPFKANDVEDTWRADGTCSYCGSINPDETMKRIREGEKVTPTDKDYKIYIGPGHGKAYFQHFDEGHKKELIDLVNAHKINFGEPGHFYVLPFFTKPVPAEN